MKHIYTLAASIGLFLCSNTALAEDAVVVPLYSPNVPSAKIGNMTSLITSAVDFSGRYDMVTQASTRPSTLNPACLKSVPCLKKIAGTEGVDAMVTGSVKKVGGNLEFFIVMYEDSKIIRMKRFTIEDSPVKIATDVGGYVQEIITGKSQETEEEQNEALAFDALSEEEDIFGGSDPLADFSLDSNDNSSSLPTNDLLDNDPLDSDALDNDPLAEDSSTEEFSFSFAPSSAEIVDNDTSSNSGTSTSSTSSFTDVDEEREFTLDLSNNSNATSSSSNRTPPPKKNSTPDLDRGVTTKKSNNSSASHMGAAATLTGTAGGGNFQTLNFITYGGEVGVHLSDMVAINLGVHGYSTNQPTPELDEDGNETGIYLSRWSVIVPINLGIAFHFPGKTAKPYAGVDLITIPGYAGPNSGLAMGARVRGGCNFMVADNFGFNFNVGAGMWSGQYFTLISNGLGGTLNPSGFAPEISVGPVIAF